MNDDSLEEYLQSAIAEPSSGSGPFSFAAFSRGDQPASNTPFTRSQMMSSGAIQQVLDQHKAERDFLAQSAQRRTVEATIQPSDHSRRRTDNAPRLGLALESADLRSQDSESPKDDARYRELLQSSTAELTIVSRQTERLLQENKRLELELEKMSNLHEEFSVLQRQHRINQEEHKRFQEQHKKIQEHLAEEQAHAAAAASANARHVQELTANISELETRLKAVAAKPQESVVLEKARLAERVRAQENELQELRQALHNERGLLEQLKEVGARARTTHQNELARLAQSAEQEAETARAVSAAQVSRLQESQQTLLSQNRKLAREHSEDKARLLALNESARAEQAADIARLTQTLAQANAQVAEQEASISELSLHKRTLAAHEQEVTAQREAAQFKVQQLSARVSELLSAQTDLGRSREAITDARYSSRIKLKCMWVWSRALASQRLEAVQAEARISQSAFRGKLRSLYSDLFRMKDHAQLSMAMTRWTALFNRRRFSKLALARAITRCHIASLASCFREWSRHVSICNALSREETRESEQRALRSQLATAEAFRGGALEHLHGVWQQSRGRAALAHIFHEWRLLAWRLQSLERNAEVYYARARVGRMRRLFGGWHRAAMGAQLRAAAAHRQEAHTRVQQLKLEQKELIARQLRESFVQVRMQRHKRVFSAWRALAAVRARTTRLLQAKETSHKLFAKHRSVQAQLLEVRVETRCSATVTACARGRLGEGAAASQRSGAGPVALRAVGAAELAGGGAM
jgi:hypothetical protein